MKKISCGIDEVGMDCDWDCDYCGSKSNFCANFFIIDFLHADSLFDVHLDRTFCLKR